MTHKPAAIVELDGHRLAHQRLGGHQLHFETRRPRSCGVRLRAAVALRLNLARGVQTAIARAIPTDAIPDRARPRCLARTASSGRLTVGMLMAPSIRRSMIGRPAGAGNKPPRRQFFRFSRRTVMLDCGSYAVQWKWAP